MSREQNRSYRGHGLRMLQGKATFDSSGGYGLADTKYIYTLKYTQTQLSQSARFIAHLESVAFSSRTKAFPFFFFILSSCCCFWAARGDI